MKPEMYINKFGFVLFKNVIPNISLISISKQIVKISKQIVKKIGYKVHLNINLGKKI